MNTYERTNLWSRGLSASADDPDKIIKERLRAAYRQFWANAATLAREIQRDLPNLTLHDEAHFEALWSRADQIAGPDFILSPLETFVFGGAILLHDAANTIAAFPGRLTEVQQTPEWRDAVAQWADQANVDPSSPLSDEAKQVVLFETLRSLHAERAETLASLEVTVGSQQFKLLQDDQLRVHLGGLIGAIAASHHWDVETLPSRLPERRGSLVDMPPSWAIRPVLLACLLRCSDAMQLDQKRAPDFLYGLLQLRGLSEQHWRAQNRLSTPHIDPHDPHALVFTSTIPFSEDDADAWWIAHDAIQVANRELQASDSLLRDLRLPSLATNRVRGAESPSRLAEHVRVTGWRPVAAEVRISRVDRIVEMFGGEKLYGHEMAVPLRELIQNAADAVQFRRELEPPGSSYEGSVVVRMSPVEANSEDVWLVVDDDGLGMSEAVLTGPLIDFGSSYLSSSLVKAERPGLLSKGRKRIGKFGVGFFSCFMIADEVRVSSRPFDKGLDLCRTLQFRENAITRPLLLDNRPPDFGASLSTRVAVRINAIRRAEMLTFGRTFSKKGHSITLAQLVGMLCPMLDVDVFVDIDGSRDRVHSRRWMNEDRVTWLNRILLPELHDRQEFPMEVKQAAHRLTFIDPHDPSAGLACVSSTAGGGVATVGTLRSTQDLSSLIDEFTGAIDYEAMDPRRMQSRARSRDRMAVWATEQAIIAHNSNIELPGRQYLAQRVAKFGGDATPIASIQLNRKWVSLEEIFRLLSNGEKIYSPVELSGSDESRLVVTHIRQRHSLFSNNYRASELEFLVPTMEGYGSASTEPYYIIPTESDPAPVGFYALLKRYANENGFNVSGEFIPEVEFAKYIGEASPREKLVPGKLISHPAVKLWAQKM